MWFRMNLRMLKTGTMAQVLGVYLSYLLGETLYMKMLEIARGRNPYDIQKEWETDPLGSFISSASRLPMVGYTQFLIGSVVDVLRQWSGRQFGNEGIFGYSDAPAYGFNIGSSGGLTSVHTLLRSLGDIVNMLTDGWQGDKIKREKVMRSLRVIPVPFRPIILAAFGLANAEDEIRASYPSYDIPYSNKNTDFIHGANRQDYDAHLGMARARREAENQTLRARERDQINKNKLQSGIPRTPDLNIPIPKSPL